MNIEIGDIVQTRNKLPRLFGALLVVEIIDQTAICAYSLLDKDLDGDERPTSYSSTTGSFPIDELTILRKREE